MCIISQNVYSQDYSACGVCHGPGAQDATCAQGTRSAQGAIGTHNIVLIIKYYYSFESLGKFANCFAQVANPIAH